MKIGIANDQQKYKFFGMSFYFWKNKHKQSGAAEACWAHNPEFRRSKLRSATHMFFWWCNVFSKNFFVHSTLAMSHRWFSGRMFACHVGGPGSIPGQSSTRLVRTQKYFCKIVVWSEIVFEDHIQTKQHKVPESLRNLIKSNFNTKPCQSCGLTS